MNPQKLKIIISYNTFKDFSIFENLYSLLFFFKKNFNQIFFSIYITKKSKKLIILRSPFANKKSRSQLGFLFYKGKITLNFNYKIINYFFFKELFKYLKIQIIQNKIFFKVTFVQIGFLF